MRDLLTELITESDAGGALAALVAGALISVWSLLFGRVTPKSKGNFHEVE